MLVNAPPSGWCVNSSAFSIMNGEVLRFKLLRVDKGFLERQSQNLRWYDYFKCNSFVYSIFREMWRSSYLKKSNCFFYIFLHYRTIFLVVVLMVLRCHSKQSPKYSTVFVLIFYVFTSCWCSLCSVQDTDECIDLFYCVVQRQCHKTRMYSLSLCFCNFWFLFWKIHILQNIMQNFQKNKKNP